MQFKWGITFNDLHQQNGLVQVNGRFMQHLQEADEALRAKLLEIRSQSGDVVTVEQSMLAAAVAPHVRSFIEQLFSGKDAEYVHEAWHGSIVPLYRCKAEFVRQHAVNALTPDAASRIDAQAILHMLPFVHAEDDYFELAFAKTVMGWLAQEQNHHPFIEMAARYAAWAVHTDAGQTKHASGVLFAPMPVLCFEQLVAEAERASV